MNDVEKRGPNTILVKNGGKTFQEGFLVNAPRFLPLPQPQIGL